MTAEIASCDADLSDSTNQPLSPRGKQPKPYHSPAKAATRREHQYTQQTVPACRSTFASTVPQAACSSTKGNDSTAPDYVARHHPLTQHSSGNIIAVPRGEHEPRKSCSSKGGSSNGSLEAIEKLLDRYRPTRASCGQNPEPRASARSSAEVLSHATNLLTAAGITSGAFF